jgi:hypothetical protein
MRSDAMVIIDMEMPKCCADCVFFVQVAGSEVTECIMPEGREGQWCPLDEYDEHKEE